MAASNNVSDKDNGAKALLKRIENLKRSAPVVKVGILADEQHGESSLLMIASVHEFGGGNVPERSFIRSTVDQQETTIKRLQKNIAAKVLEGKMSPKQGLGTLGEYVQSEMQKTIRAGIAPELTPATLARKTLNDRTGDVPLIDTAQMIQSIAYEVEE